MIFRVFTILSLLGYVFGFRLFYAWFLEEGPGMIMIFFVPALLFGLITGLVAFFTKKKLKVGVGVLMSNLHFFNKICMVIGTGLMIYTVLN